MCIKKQCLLFSCHKTTTMFLWTSRTNWMTMTRSNKGADLCLISSLHTYIHKTAQPTLNTSTPPTPIVYSSLCDLQWKNCRHCLHKIFWCRMAVCIPDFIKLWFYEFYKMKGHRVRGSASWSPTILFLHECAQRNTKRTKVNLWPHYNRITTNYTKEIAKLGCTVSLNLWRWHRDLWNITGNPPLSSIWQRKAQTKTRFPEGITL